MNRAFDLPPSVNQLLTVVFDTFEYPASRSLDERADNAMREFERRMTELQNFGAICAQRLPPGAEHTADALGRWISSLMEQLTSVRTMPRRPAIRDIRVGDLVIGVKFTQGQNTAYRVATDEASVILIDLQGDARYGLYEFFEATSAPVPTTDVQKIGDLRAPRCSRFITARHILPAAASATP
jgi:hypothetical protein